jgi:hypothetical protein
MSIIASTSLVISFIFSENVVLNSSFVNFFTFTKSPATSTHFYHPVSTPEDALGCQDSPFGVYPDNSGYSAKARTKDRTKARTAGSAEGRSKGGFAARSDAIKTG